MRPALLITLFLLMSPQSYSQIAAPPSPPSQDSAERPGALSKDSSPSPAKAQKTGDWIRNLDLGKLVGAATAPVNLIIAATIAISFLIAKQGALFAKFLLILEQYKKQPEDRVTSDKLYHQLGIYAKRLRLINWACRALGITIVVFIGTVILTSLGVTFPDLAWVKIGTGITLFGGLLSMFIGFVLELADGGMEGRSIDLEMKEVSATRNDPH